MHSRGFVSSELSSAESQIVIPLAATRGVVAKRLSNGLQIRVGWLAIGHRPILTLPGCRQLLPTGDVTLPHLRADSWIFGSLILGFRVNMQYGIYEFLLRL